MVPRTIPRFLIFKLRYKQFPKLFAGLRACQQATESVLTELALMLKSGDTTAADQAIGRLQEAAARLDGDASQAPGQGHDPTLGGYLWLNLHLIEQLTHLHRLLGLVLQPYAKPSARP